MTQAEPMASEGGNEVEAKAPGKAPKAPKTTETAQPHWVEQIIRTPIEKERLTSGLMGLLTGPHQTSFSVWGSLTTRLSEGDLPVFAPE